MKSKGARLHGVGIDVVSKSRVRQFLSRHRTMIENRFLNPTERKKVSSLDAACFAELFTAKEAFFKACGEPWMGLEGFQGMRITKREGDSFQMKWRVRCSGRSYKGGGCFFRDGDLVGAHAMIWSS